MENNLLPWVADVQTFLQNCTQCADCIAACPENIIVKGDGGYPNIDFNLGECTFCTKCAESCQEPLFLPGSAPPWNKKARINASCLALAQVHCRSCAESCEAQALTFELAFNAAPQIDNDLCTGCGACVAPCPTQAIVIGNNDEPR